MLGEVRDLPPQDVSQVLILGHLYVDRPRVGAVREWPHHPLHSLQDLASIQCSA